MANDVIPVEQHASVWEDFAHVEHKEIGEGVHARYLALAKVLEQGIVV
jgi:hypothetical protein